MANHTADIIIVGGGVMGCAAAYQLAKDGRSVLLLEQYTIGNRMGSSHGVSRLFRLAHTQAYYVELARAAKIHWLELENESGRRLMQPVDAIDLGSDAALKELGATLQATGVPFVPMSSEEIVRGFPQFRLPENVWGLHQDNYAMIRADATVSAMAELARRNGATIAEGQRVQQISPRGDSVEVSTGQASYSAGCVIVCAGSWMRPLVQTLGIDLPLIIRKELITFYKPEDREAWMPGRFPLFRHHLDGKDGRWGVGFPIFEHEGAKMLVDCTGPVVSPEDTDRSADQAVLNKVRDYVADMLPTLGENIIEAETCRYTMTPDEDFILDRHPEYPQVVMVSPCSGHGFKFAPLIGRILADLATRGTTQYDIQRFRVDRPGLIKPSSPATSI